MEHERAAAQRAAEEGAAEERAAEERVRIAQELHDVSAHTLAVINVQAGVASELLADSPDQAREALDAVRRAGRATGRSYPYST
ncbi:MAG TPA: histidine kinase dimerization/phosphoacceptor domain-containing protein [Actinomadura sp.]|nr:histidine kinase dimerization/phosphoacceptor domain-containing protein [Actinomadura sp.]